MRGDLVFKARANGPTGFVVADVRAAQSAADNTDVGRRVTVGEAAGHIKRGPIPRRRADPRTRRSEIIRPHYQSRAIRCAPMRVRVGYPEGQLAISSTSIHNRSPKLALENGRARSKLSCSGAPGRGAVLLTSDLDRSSAGLLFNVDMLPWLFRNPQFG